MHILHRADRARFTRAHQFHGSRRNRVGTAGDLHRSGSLVKHESGWRHKRFKLEPLAGLQTKLADLERMAVGNDVDLRRTGAFELEHAVILVRRHGANSNPSYRQPAYRVSFSLSSLTMWPPLRSIAP